MKVAGVIVWMLVSAAVFGKSIEDSELEWLAIPSMLSTVIAIVMFIIKLV